VTGTLGKVPTRARTSRWSKPKRLNSSALSTHATPICSLTSESLAPAEVIKYWVHRGGLLADVLSSGEIVRGAFIETAA
jgi:hypothetical protein